MYDLCVQDGVNGAVCNPDPLWSDDPPTGCGDPMTAQLWFLSFTLVVSFVMVNLFVAVIIEGFADITSGEQRLLPVAAHLSDALCGSEEESAIPVASVDMFSRYWSFIDPDATLLAGVSAVRGPGRGVGARQGVMPLADASRLMELFQVLPPPMGFGFMYHASRQEMEALIGVLSVPGVMLFRFTSVIHSGAFDSHLQGEQGTLHGCALRLRHARSEEGLCRQHDGRVVLVMRVGIGSGIPR